MKYVISSFEINAASLLSLFECIPCIQTRQNDDERMLRSDVALSKTTKVKTTLEDVNDITHCNSTHSNL